MANELACRYYEYQRCEAYAIRERDPRMGHSIDLFTSGILRFDRIWTLQGFDYSLQYFARNERVLHTRFYGLGRNSINYELIIRLRPRSGLAVVG